VAIAAHPLDRLCS